MSGAWDDPNLRARLIESLGERLIETEALVVTLGPGARAEGVRDALRTLHGIKGDLIAFGLGQAGELAHGVEQLLETTGGAATPVEVALLLETLDALRGLADGSKGDGASLPSGLVDRLRSASEEAGRSRRDQGDGGPTGAVTTEAKGQVTGPAVRVLAAQLDAWLESAQRAQRELVRGGVQRAGQGQALDALCRGLLTARQVPAARLEGWLKRVALEASRATGKEVQLQVDGASIALEAWLSAAIAELLPHVVRNAIDHGIERPDARQRAGKPSEGLVEVCLELDGGNLRVTVHDDGAGIDTARVEERAVALGHFSREALARLTAHERLQLVTMPGLSTRDAITAVSGRGVGLDAVHTRVRELGGALEVATLEGAGTSVELRFALGGRWEDFLLVDVGGSTLGIPVAAVLEILPAGSAPTPSQGLIVLGSGPAPLVGFESLDPRFGLEVSRPLVVLDAAGLPLGLAVDALLGFCGSVVHGLAQPSVELPVVAGVGQRPDRSPFWALDAAALSRTWNGYTVPFHPSSSPSRRRSSMAAPSSPSSAAPSLVSPPEPEPCSTRPASLEEEVRTLSAERAALERELGVADAAQIIAMVRSLEEQLVSLYEEREAGADHVAHA